MCFACARSSGARCQRADQDRPAELPVVTREEELDVDAIGVAAAVRVRVGWRGLKARV